MPPLHPIFHETLVAPPGRSELGAELAEHFLRIDFDRTCLTEIHAVTAPLIAEAGEALLPRSRNYANVKIKRVVHTSRGNGLAGAIRNPLHHREPRSVAACAAVIGSGVSALIPDIYIVHRAATVSGLDVRL